MLGLTQLQKTLNQTIDLIHPGLLQPTEAYRLLRRELALSTFGFLCLFYKYKKNYQFQSKWLDVSHKEISYALFLRSIYYMLLPGSHLTRLLLGHTMGTSATPPAFSIQVPTTEPSVPSADASSVLQFPDQSRNMKGSIKMGSPTRVSILILSMERWMG